jgi:hypothetical protein
MLINPGILPNPLQWNNNGCVCKDTINSHHLTSLNILFKVDVTCKSLMPSTYSADAVLDLIVHNAHRIKLMGESLRKHQILMN